MSDKDVIDTLIAEAYAEGPEGMRRVAETIINRAAVRGLTLDQVVRQPKQYTGYEHPGAAAKKAQQSPAARSAAEAALQLALQPGDPTGGADHYLNPNVAHPSWASKIPSTGSYGNHQFFASRPIPPAEISNTVGTFLDTVRMPPQPASQSGSVAFRRQNTSPLGDNTALPGALAQYAQRQANQVTPAIRRPALPPMGTPDVNALYAGIYPQASQVPGPSASDAVRGRTPMTTLTNGGRAPIGLRQPGNLDLNSRRVLNAMDGSIRTENSMSIGTDQGEVLIPTVVNGRQLSDQAAIDHYQSTGENLGTFKTPQAADKYAEGLHVRQGQYYGGDNRPVRPSAVPQSQVDRGAVRIPPVQGNLTNPGAIDASVNGLSQSPALQAALSRRIASPAPVPQSQIERTQLPIGQSQIERTALPRNVPPDLISQSMQRIASANPTQLPPIAPSTIGQPPSTRTVQSVAMPALGAVPSRTPPRVTVSTPYTVPQRMAAQDIGNVRRALPQATPFVPEQRYIEPRNVAPVQPYQGPFVPNKGLERLATPTALSFNPIQQPPAFTTQMQPTQVLNPAWSATPAAIPAGTPMSGGLSRDAVALRAKGLAAAQAMANVPKYITVQKPVQVPVRVPAQSPALAPSRVAASAPSIAPLAAMTPTQQAQNQLGLTSAQAYAFLNSFSGGPRTAADRPGKSLSQSGGSGGIASW